MATEILKPSGEIIISHAPLSELTTRQLVEEIKEVCNGSLPRDMLGPTEPNPIIHECWPSHAGSRALPKARRFCEQGTRDVRQGDAANDVSRRERLIGERRPSSSSGRSWIVIWIAALFLFLMGTVAGCTSYGGKPVPPPPPAPPPAPTPPPEPKSGDRFSTFWNVWAEDGQVPCFEPVTSLKPNTNYRISIDLAALEYIAAGVLAVPTSQTFKIEVEKWLKPGMPDPILKVMLLADPKKFEASPIVKDFKVNLSHLRKVWKSGSAKDDDCFKTLRERFDEKKEEPDWKFGGIYFDVKTRNIEGRSAIAFSIWEKERPIDEVSIPFCIAKSPGEEKQKCGDLEKKVYPQGLFSVRLATETSEGPVAALHFVELDHDERVIGVLHSHLWAANKYLVWQLNQTAAQFPTAISTQFLSSIEKPISDENLLVRGETLFELLFPANAQSIIDGRKVRDEVLNMLRPYLQKDPSLENYIPPTIFIRMIQIGSTPSLPLPLGLLAVRRDKSQKMTRENGQFLGEYFLIETPLEMQTYAPAGECLSNWVMVLPPEDTGDQDINDARSQLGSTINKWTKNIKEKSFNKMGDFMEWIGPSSIGQAEEPPVILVTLSHHGSGNLNFYKIDSDKDNPLPFSKINRTFKEPSAAILNGCGTGGESAVGMIHQLNGQGFTSIIATSTEVGGLMAGAFLKIFAEEISMSGTSNPKNIGLAYWRSVRKLSQTKPTGVTPTKPFGAQALKYCLLGNGRVAVCAPKGPNQ